MTTRRLGPVIDDEGRVISGGEYVGRLVQLKNRRWVYGRPGKAPSAWSYATDEEAARALVDSIV